MSLQTIERYILGFAKIILENPKLRMKDMMEWCNSEEQVKRNLQEDEVMIYIKDPGVWAAFKKEHDKRKS